MEREGWFLLVENDAQGARTTSRILRRFAPTVVTTTADEAVDKINDWSFWLGILVDLNLHDPDELDTFPDRSGYAVAVHARSRRPEALVTLYSAYSDEETFRRAEARGIETRLKPMSLTSWAQHATQAATGIALSNAAPHAEPLARSALREAVRRCIDMHRLTPAEGRLLSVQADTFDERHVVLSRREAADTLGIELGTYKAQAAAVLKKTNASSMVELLAWLQRQARIALAERIPVERPSSSGVRELGVQIAPTPPRTAGAVGYRDGDDGER